VRIERCSNAIADLARASVDRARGSRAGVARCRVARRECVARDVSWGVTLNMAKIEEISSSASAGGAVKRAGEGEKTEASGGTAPKRGASGGASEPAATPAAPQLSPKMFISPVLLLRSKRLGIDYKNPEHVMNIRLIFLLSMTAVVLALAALWMSITRKKKKLEEDSVEVKVKNAQTGEVKTEKVSLYEHDVREFRKVLTSFFTGCMMTSGIHAFFKVVPPLLLQSIMMPLNLWDGNLWQAHVLGRSETKYPALKRPWQEPEQKSPFAALAEAMSPDAKGKNSAESNRAAKDPKKNSKKK